MDSRPIPDDVTRFILLSVPSVPYLEAMLLLRRDTRQAWDPARLAQRLYLSDSAAQTLLAELHASGILEVADPDARMPLYRYHPRSEELRQMIDRLAEVYAKNLIEISNLIHSKISKKAQQFADAFMWRKDS
jgi:Mn-dependent DtxR family transcriptional regulator